MNPHLTSQQISEWIAGQKTGAMEEHLQDCEECAGEVGRVTETLGLFRASVIAFSEQQLGPARLEFLAERRRRVASPSVWGLSLATAAALLIAAIPLARHFQPASHPSHPAEQVVTAQVSDEALLRQVETEISRSVPATMEPLQKLMSGDDNGRAE